MDKKIDEILSKDYAPKVDINARKRAVNLAVAEFKTEQQKKSKKSYQGSSIITRLISIGNKKQGVKTMKDRAKKRFIYGGAATAMAVILVGGLSLTQLDDTVRRNQKLLTTAPEVVVQENKSNLEQAIIESSTSIPVPVEVPIKTQDQTKIETKTETQDLRSPAPKPKEKAVKPLASDSLSDPLKDWRRKSDDSASVSEQNNVKRPITELKEEVFVDDIAQAPVAKASSPKIESDNNTQGMSSSMLSAMPERDKSLLGKSISKPKLYNASPSIVITSPNAVINDDYIPPSYKDEGRDKFEDFDINQFKSVATDPVSTFSSDVDTASYSFIRRQLNNGVLPQKDAVRIEEMINYFDYNYPLPKNQSEPFKPTVTIIDSPWAEGKKLMHIGIKGYQLEPTELRSNIVFLLDVSGSMNAPDKLPLVKNSMKMLLDSLHKDDTVSIVVYAGSTGVVLEPTKVYQRNKIITAMNNLRAGGGTAGAAGIKLAYDMAEQNFDEHAVNRVILATDGDFNVGITNREELQDFVERKRDKGIFLSVLGFGQGNYNDHMMQTLAQNGNGIAAYIDNLNEARKVLVQEATSSLFPIAKDVKFQVEFNPDKVAEYRLIGYETRALKREDFNNDKIDAGDMGAGHSVTAIYEFVPVGSKAISVDPLRYGKATPPTAKKGKATQEYAFLKIRYKLPKENKSKLITLPIYANGKYSQDLTDTKFATAVAAFGQILKGGQYTGNFSYDDVIALAQQGKGADKFGYRAEFINMVRLAKTLSR